MIRLYRFPENGQCFFTINQNNVFAPKTNNPNKKKKGNISVIGDIVSSGELNIFNKSVFFEEQ